MCTCGGSLKPWSANLCLTILLTASQHVVIQKCASQHNVWWLTKPCNANLCIRFHLRHWQPCWPTRKPSQPCFCAMFSLRPSSKRWSRRWSRWWLWFLWNWDDHNDTDDDDDDAGCLRQSSKGECLRHGSSKLQAWNELAKLGGRILAPIWFGKNKLEPAVYWSPRL